MRIGVIAHRRWPAALGPLMSEAARLLVEWGVDVEAVHPEESSGDVAALGRECDLYLLEARSDLALSLAGALEADDATIVNPPAVAVTCRDRLVATRILQRAGVPVPASYAVAHAGKLAPLLEDGPLLVTPWGACAGGGSRLVRDIDELDAMTDVASPVFAQRHDARDARLRSIACVGGQLFGVERGWPDDEGYEPFPLTPDLCELALRAGRAFGMELFGVDLSMSDGRPHVTEVSSVPRLSSVPDGALRLADYAYDAVRRVVSDEPLRTVARGAGAL